MFEDIGELLLAIILLLGLAVVLLLVYGVVVIVFDMAYGIELPNPFDWFERMSNQARE